MERPACWRAARRRGVGEVDWLVVILGVLSRRPMAVVVRLRGRRERRELGLRVVERSRHAADRVSRDALGVGLGKGHSRCVRRRTSRRVVLVLVVVAVLVAVVLVLVLILLLRARVGSFDRLDRGLADLLQRLVGALDELVRRAAAVVTAQVYEGGVVLRERAVHRVHRVAERARVAGCGVRLVFVVLVAVAVLALVGHDERRRAVR